MVKLSLALRVVALSALMLGAVIAEDASPDVSVDAADVVESAAKLQEPGKDAVPDAQAAAGAAPDADAKNEAAEMAEEPREEAAPGVDVAAAGPDSGDAAAAAQVS